MFGRLSRPVCSGIFRISFMAGLFTDTTFNERYIYLLEILNTFKNRSLRFLSADIRKLKVVLNITGILTRLWFHVVLVSVNKIFRGVTRVFIA